MGAAVGRELKIAIVGATGAVGGQIVELIGARAMPCSDLGLFAAERGATQSVEAMGREYRVSELDDPADISRFDVAFLAVPPSWAADIVRARPGPILIDLSAAGGRDSSHETLVAPGFTSPEVVANAASHDKAVAIPHPAAHVLASIMTAAGAGVSLACAALLVGASSAGRQAVQEVAREAAELLSGSYSPQEGEAQRAFNEFPADPAGRLAEVIATQTAELLDTSPRLLIDVVNVATLHGTAMTVFVPDAAPGLAASLRGAPGILLVEGDDQTAGVIDAIGQEAVLIKVNAQPAGAVVWCVFDSARLAALDAVWVAEKLASVGAPGAA